MTAPTTGPRAAHTTARARTNGPTGTAGTAGPSGPAGTAGTGLGPGRLAALAAGLLVAGLAGCGTSSTTSLPPATVTVTAPDVAGTDAPGEPGATGTGGTEPGTAASGIIASSSVPTIGATATGTATTGTAGTATTTGAATGASPAPPLTIGAANPGLVQSYDAASVAVTAAATDAGAATFRSPTGNITCGFGPDGGGCQVADGLVDAPAGMTCAPPAAQVGSVRLSAAGVALQCGAAPPGEAPPVLPYGTRSTVAGSPYVCLSETGGVTCIDTGSRRGFFVARGTFAIF